MTQDIKQKVRAILYARPTGKELEAFTGKSHNLISGNKSYGENSEKAHAYDVDVMQWKIDKICDVTQDCKEIMDIIDYEPQQAELVRHSGRSRGTVSTAKKNFFDDSKERTYSYPKMVLSYKIDKIAELVE